MSVILKLQENCGMKLIRQRKELLLQTNWLESDELGISTRHHLSLYFRLGIIENAWKGSDDIYQSQYDRRQI